MIDGYGSGEKRKTYVLNYTIQTEKEFQILRPPFKLVISTKFDKLE